MAYGGPRGMNRKRRLRSVGRSKKAVKHSSRSAVYLDDY